MKTLIKREKTATGWAHWFRIGKLVLIEFVDVEGMAIENMFTNSLVSGDVL